MDPFQDNDDEFGSDKNYEPSSSHSESSSVDSRQLEEDEENGLNMDDAVTPSSSGTLAVENLLWETTTAPIPDFGFNENSSGLKVPIDPDAKPPVVFFLIFTNEILEYIIE